MSNTERVLEEYNKNNKLSGRAIGEILGMPRSTVNSILSKAGIKRDREAIRKLNNTGRSYPIIIPDLIKEVITGSVLGDGHMRPYVRTSNSKLNCNSALSIVHGSKQKEYIEYKRDLVLSTGISCTLTDVYFSTKDHYIKGVLVKDNGTYTLRVQKNISFNYYRDMFYKNNFKQIPEGSLEHLTPLAIAIWFMDDGYKHVSSYYFSTDSFDLESLRVIRKALLERYTIHTRIHKGAIKDQYRLYVSTKSKDTLTNLIQEHIIPSMRYKLHRCPSKNPLNEGHPEVGNHVLN